MTYGWGPCGETAASRPEFPTFASHQPSAICRNSLPQLEIVLEQPLIVVGMPVDTFGFQAFHGDLPDEEGGKLRAYECGFQA